MLKYFYIVSLVLLVSNPQQSFASVFCDAATCAAAATCATAVSTAVSVVDKVSSQIQYKQYCLSQAQLKSYDENGFLIVPNFFDSQEIERIKDCTHRLQVIAEGLSKDQTIATQLAVHKEAQLKAQKKEDGLKVLNRGAQFVISKPADKVVIHRISWACGENLEPDLLALGRQLKLLVPVVQLLKSLKMDHLICQVHPKSPGDGVGFGWHQDRQNRLAFDSNFPDGPYSFVQTLMAATKMTKENGGLLYVPGSHKCGYLALGEKLPADPLFSQFQEQAELISMNAGDMLFMNPLLVHGSSPNISGDESDERILFINGFSPFGFNKGQYPGVGSGQTISPLS